MGDSVASVNITFFSSHDLRYRLSLGARQSLLPTAIRTTTSPSSLYHFNPELERSKGWLIIGTASQRLTAESATPTQGDASMSCFMPCHACHATAQPLPLLSRVALLPNPTPIALTGAASMIDSLSPHLIGSRLQLCIEAGE